MTWKYNWAYWACCLWNKIQITSSTYFRDHRQSNCKSASPDICITHTRRKTDRSKEEKSCHRMWFWNQSANHREDQSHRTIIQHRSSWRNGVHGRWRKLKSSLVTDSYHWSSSLAWIWSPNHRSLNSSARFKS